MSTEATEATPQEIVANATPEQIQPNPVVWPVCGDCGSAYVLARPLFIFRREGDGEGSDWAWIRPEKERGREGCKHKGAAKMMTAAGEYEADA